MDRRKVVARILVAVCILSLMVSMLGCVSGPSKADIEEAVLRTIAKRLKWCEEFFGAAYMCEYYWVGQVEVIDIGRPYTYHSALGDFTYWPVKVYLIGDHPKEEIRIDVYNDEFGEWQVLGL